MSKVNKNKSKAILGGNLSREDMEALLQELFLQRDSSREDMDLSHPLLNPCFDPFDPFNPYKIGAPKEEVDGVGEEIGETENIDGREGEGDGAPVTYYDKNGKQIFFK